MSQPFMEIDHLRELTLARDLSPHILTAGAFGYFVEPPGNGLHHLFFLRMDGRTWVGRKVLQLDRHQRWQASSVLKPTMLLGPHVQSQWSNEGLSICFRPVSPEAKAAFFESALAGPDSEIQFPFPLLDADGQEAVCPPRFWHCNDGLAVQLDAEEQHLREHCAGLLQTSVAAGSLIYDPACSTGRFIAHLAHSLSDCRFLGTDRSASMIEHAKHWHAATPVEFRLLDAGDAYASGVRCDVLILRFLNAEVLTRQQAQTLFESLIGCVEPGGTVLVFGHTPVLLAVNWLAAQFGLRLESSVAARPGQMELFQFYRLRVAR